MTLIFLSVTFSYEMPLAGTLSNPCSNPVSPTPLNSTTISGFEDNGQKDMSNGSKNEYHTFTQVNEVCDS